MKIATSTWTCIESKKGGGRHAMGEKKKEDIDGGKPSASLYFIMTTHVPFSKENGPI